MPEYNFRVATMEDLEDVYDMAKEFYEASPYATTHEFSEARVKEVIRIYLSAPLNEAVVVLMLDGELPVGMIAGVNTANLFSEGSQAIEQVWWVDPPHRKTRASITLLMLFEEWAKEIGAKYCVMSSIPELTELSRLFEGVGFRLKEQSYLKEVF